MTSGQDAARRPAREEVRLGGTPLSLIRTKTTVGTDGVVRLSVGPELAGREVEVTVEPAPEEAPPSRKVGSSIQYPPGWRKLTQEEWVRHLKATAGSIDDPTFVRPVTGPPQDRGPIFD